MKLNSILKRTCNSGVVTAALVNLASAVPAHATYPDRPIKLVVPYSAGGSTDSLARQLAQSLARQMQVTIVIENKPGASTNIGTESVVRAAPDGYTLLLASSALALNPAFGPEPTFDALKGLTAISLIGQIPYALASSPAVSFDSPKAFIQAARAAPGRYSVGSAGLDAIVTGLNQGAKMDLRHVPYRGGAQATIDALAGHVDLVLTVVPVILPHVKTGRLKAIAVTSARRDPSLPDVPTLSESGESNYTSVAWFGLMAPAGTPPEIVQRLAAETREALSQPELRKRLEADGVEVQSSTPLQLEKRLRNDLADAARQAEQSHKKGANTK